VRNAESQAQQAQQAPHFPHLHLAAQQHQEARQRGGQGAPPGKEEGGPLEQQESRHRHYHQREMGVWRKTRRKLHRES
jgi:hypothetical protein